MEFLSGDPDDEFKRLPVRVCAWCGGSATCRRISTTNGLATAYQYKCDGCAKTFTISALFTLILFAVGGLFILWMGIMIGSGQDKHVTSVGETALYGIGAVLFGVAALAFVGSRIRTARKNPVRRGA